MPDLFSSNEKLDKQIKSFMDRKMDQHPDLKSMKMKDITDYIEY